jgi:aspartokinase-like uncharacterized kinase
MTRTSKPDDRVCVVKIGGSLLDWSELRTAWHCWREQQPGDRRFLLIAGGGMWVEQIRTHQCSQGWTDSQAHWMAIDCLAVTARVLAHRLQIPWHPWTGSRCLRQVQNCNSATDSRPCTVLDVACWLKHEEVNCNGPRLPIGWGTTSDAIAARVAQSIGGCELVLVKSCAAPAGDVGEWVRQGYVDSSVESYAPWLSDLRAINLRDVA